MFRPAIRVIARPSAVRAIPRATAPTRRFVSTAPTTQKSRSWKSLAARLGVLGTGLYYYTTTDFFAEEPQHLVHVLPETEEANDQLPTIEAITAERQKRKAEIEAAQQQEAQQAALAGDVEESGQDAGQQGAFNPITGEINWDCPCLGGMAHGPCGEEFKAAFSCFVYSDEEPKGIECIENFQAMQNCFRQYPEIYDAELANDVDDDAALEGDSAVPAPAVSAESAVAQSESSTAPKKTSEEPKAISEEAGLVPESYRKGTESKQTAVDPVKEVEAVSTSGEIIPKAVHDAVDANEQK